MNRRLEMDLMRLLHGELPAGRARELKARIAREPELAAAYRRLAAAWQGLDLPPAAPPPPGFEGRVMAHVRAAARGAGGLSWTLAPVWVRAVAATALVAGLALGVGLEAGSEPLAGADPAAAASASLDAAPPAGLAESYWSAVEDDDAAAPADDEGGEAWP